LRSSRELNSTPLILRPNANTGSQDMLRSFPCGIATPSPIPVLPNSSRSRSMRTISASDNSGKRETTFAASSARTSSLSVAVRSGMIASAGRSVSFNPSQQSVAAGQSILAGSISRSCHPCGDK
jgi:hypothetical protein